MPLYSILDLAPILQGEGAGLSFRNAVDLARHAEGWGYERFWLAEHHNMPGIASAATAVVVCQVAENTSRIRVGSGGVMLPNHSPLVIAEQFGTLEAMFPGRIDLGLGRAPGSDQLTTRALRRDPAGGDAFPDDVLELQNYFRPVVPGQRIRAVPGAGLEVPLYLLGSSDFSARLAASLGLPFAFASHFAPDYLQRALALYRSGFRASDQQAIPHAMIGINVFAADTDAEAQQLFTSLQLQFLSLLRGNPDELRPAVAPAKVQMSAAEAMHLERMTRYSVIGSPETVRTQLLEILRETQADEIIATGQIHDHSARLRSFEIFSEVMGSLADR